MFLDVWQNDWFYLKLNGSDDKSIWIGHYHDVSAALSCFGKGDGDYETGAVALLIGSSEV